MGKMSRDKGKRVEVLHINKLREAGLDAYRIPLSGATDYAKGDIEIRLPSMTLIGESKARARMPGYLWEWLGANDFLVVKADGQHPLVMMTWEQWLALLKRAA